MPGVDSMARPKGRPRKKRAGDEAGPVERTTIINLKGTQEQADWLDEAHRATHIPKSVIVRLALAQWGASAGRPPFPVDSE